MAGFEEPEERVGLWRQVNVAGIGVDSRRGLTDPLLARLLVSYLDAIGTVDGLDPRGLLGELPLL